MCCCLWGGPCKPNGLLITLKQGTDPIVFLKKLSNSQAFAQEKRPIYLSENDLFFLVDDEAYLDFTIFSSGESRPTPSEVPSVPIWEQ